jgi:peptidoglycan/LPS O-acetylase OafA/YrhL
MAEMTDRSGAAPDYRRDIDGLRAIAVLAVVGFHAFPAWAPGGFVGVDVFFVVSGFLISGIILRGLERGTFTVREFYERRIRRIFPALILVLLAAVAIAAFVFSPPESRDLARHIIAGAGFISNFALLDEPAGYFDQIGRNQVLLHLWSLGIEEQFYIVWPVLLLALAKFRIRFTTIVLTIAVASFATSLVLTRTNPSMAFYSPLSRFWELMLGGLLAHLTLHKQLITGSRANWAALAGCGLIVAAVWLLDENVPYPGALALLPTVGTFLVIAAGSDAWPNRILSQRGLVGIGLISYPLYLWHWLLIFAYNEFFMVSVPPELRWFVKLALVVASLGLAWLTYQFVERPIRFGKASPRVVAPLVLAMLLVAAIGLGIRRTRGLAFRAPAHITALLSFKADNISQPHDKGCFLMVKEGASDFGPCVVGPERPRESVFLWGDSHAAHLYAGLKSTLGSDVRLTEQTAAACAPMLGHKRLKSPACPEINEHGFRRIVTEKPDRVILAGRWSNNRWELLGPTIDSLKAAGIRRIVLVGPVPEWSRDLPVVIYNDYRANRSNTIPTRLKPSSFKVGRELDRQMREFAAARSIEYESPISILCTAEGCLTMLGSEPKQMVAFDFNHFTLAGSSYVASRFAR